MAQRFCGDCGTPIRKLLSRSNVCDPCKEKKKIVQQEAARLKRIATATQNGLTLVHSCIIEHDLILQPPACHCNKFVTFEKARQLVRDNEAVNWETRQPKFVEGQPILLAGRRKSPARATLSGRVTIQRKGEDSGYSEEDIKRLQKIAAEDQHWRKLERLMQIQIERELECEWRKSITVEVPEADWIASEKSEYGIPIIPVKVGFDDRTLGGVGVDVPVSPERKAA